VAEMGAADAVPEVDWSRLRRLEFQEALRSRDGYASRLAQHTACTTHESFASEVSRLVCRDTRLLTVTRAVRNDARAQGAWGTHQGAQPVDLRPEPGPAARLRAAHCRAQDAALRRPRLGGSAAQGTRRVRDQLGRRAPADGADPRQLLQRAHAAGERGAAQRLHLPGEDGHAARAAPASRRGASPDPCTIERR